MARKPKQTVCIAVGVGTRFNIVPQDAVKHIDLVPQSIEVVDGGTQYTLHKGATFEESRKVDLLLDAVGDKSISEHQVKPIEKSSFEQEVVLLDDRRLPELAQDIGEQEAEDRMADEVDQLKSDIDLAADDRTLIAMSGTDAFAAYDADEVLNHVMKDGDANLVVTDNSGALMLHALNGGEDKSWEVRFLDSSELPANDPDILDQLFYTRCSKPCIAATQWGIDNVSDREREPATGLDAKAAEAREASKALSRDGDDGLGIDPR